MIPDEIDTSEVQASVIYGTVRLHCTRTGWSGQFKISDVPEHLLEALGVSAEEDECCGESVVDVVKDTFDAVPPTSKSEPDEFDQV